MTKLDLDLELDLDAIARAYGKNHTELPGSTPLVVVRVFQQVPYLIAEIRRLRADLDAVRELAGPENESGFISTDALLHTIGTGESRLTELETKIERVLEVLKTEHFACAGEYGDFDVIAVDDVLEALFGEENE